MFGAERLVAFNTPDGVSKITVRVPPGIDSGKKLRISGRGHSSPDGGSSGDLLVRINVMADSKFKREGDDLVMDAEIRPSEAFLGAKIQIETLEGKKLNLTVAPGTPSHSRLRSRGTGRLA